MPTLTDEDRAKLQSCIEAIRDVIGEAPVSEKQLVETILKHKFDCSKSLDEILNDMSRKSEPEKKSVEKKEIITKGEYFYCLTPAAPIQLMNNLVCFFIYFHVGQSNLIR